MNSVLITGGAGFIGTHLCAVLKKAGFQPIVFDLKKPACPLEGVPYHCGDIRNSEELDSVFSEYAPTLDAVFHLAAMVSINLCQEKPLESYAHNVLGTVQVLESIRKSGRRIRLAFASSAALYGHQGSDGRALRENDCEDDFLSFYAAQKRASEQAILQYSRAFQIPALIFRFFNVYGPGQDPDSPYSGVITLFIKQALNEGRLKLNGGGLNTRDFISVEDIARACEKTLRLPSKDWNGTILNLGSAERTSIAQLAQWVCEEVEKIKKFKPTLQTMPAREADVLHSLADTSKAHELLNFKAMSDLRKSLAVLIRNSL